MQRGVSSNRPTILTINSSANPVTNVSELEKYTEYEFQVLASTVVGDGPKSSSKILRTKEDGKRLLIISLDKLYYFTQIIAWLLST